MWAAAEMTRLPFYIANLAGHSVPALLRLRYSAFLVLYPLGFVGEFGVFCQVFYKVSHTVRHVGSLFKACLLRSAHQSHVWLGLAGR